MINLNRMDIKAEIEILDKKIKDADLLVKYYKIHHTELVRKRKQIQALLDEEQDTNGNDPE